MQKLINLLSNRSTQAVDNPELALHLQMLENRLRGAIRFLGKTQIKKNGKSYRLNSLPWYLLLGTAGAGKTSLLANSNINFILDKQSRRDKNSDMSSAKTCDWWAMRDAVLIDVPGGYLEAKSGHTSGSMLNHLLESMQKIRGKEAIRGVVMTISLTELLDWDNRDHLVNVLRKNIAELRAKFGNELPFYFTITKCDLLPGFVDFFNDCGSDELAQAWGVTFPVVTATDSVADICLNRFDALISRLNKQLIWRLHQERDSYARIYIKDFPLQIERIKEAFVDVLNDLTKNGNHFALKGAYLTSSVQNNISEQAPSYPQTVSANEFQRSMEIMNAPVLRKQAYFIKQFILQGILQANPPPVGNRNWHRHALASAAVLCIIVIGGLKGKDILEGFYRRTSDSSVPVQSASLVENQAKPKPEVKPPVQLVSSSVQIHKQQLARLKPGKFSNQHKEDNV